MARKEERVGFDSEGLGLEGRWRPPSPSPGPAAAICHPHPQFGGSMDNNVVIAVAEALAAAGFGALRFNFRGVGQSRGAYGAMIGEVEDVKAALAWLKARPEVAPGKAALVGYSFGGLMALYAAAEWKDPAALALVSPMNPEKGFARDPRLKPLAGSGLPVFAITGSRDLFCPPKALAALGKILSCQVRIFPDADHFWWGQEEAVAQAVAEFLSKGSGF